MAVGFLGLIAFGTFLLTLPVATADGTPTPWIDAFFTATSAVSLTGLVVEDTGTYWSFTGRVIILSLIQLSGFGIMSLASLAGMLLTGRLGLRSRMNAAAEKRSLTPGGIRLTLWATLLVTVVTELVVAAVLAVRFSREYGFPPLRAGWEGVFHAVSAFNNAGFGLRPDSLVPYVGDAWIILPIATAVILGGLGFPVIAEIAARFRRALVARLRGLPRARAPHWSVTTRLAVSGTLVLLAVGTALVWLLERNGVLSGMSPGTAALAAFFQSVTPRTAGFNSLDYAQMHPSTLTVTSVLMFIGGSSAGTAGGIKITTLLVLVAAIVAEVRGRKETTIGHRAIESSVVRQAMAVAAVSVVLVVGAIIAIRILDPKFTGDQVVFEVVSAFGTAGLSTGITADLSPLSQGILCVLMYLGRIGPLTLVTALALHQRSLRISYPTERPYIG